MEGTPDAPQGVEQVEFPHDDVEGDEQGEKGHHGGGQDEVEEVVAPGIFEAGEDEAAHGGGDEDAEDGAGGDDDAVEIGDGQVGARRVHHHAVGVQGPLLWPEGDGQAHDVGAGLEGGEEQPDEGVEHGEAAGGEEEDGEGLGPPSRDEPAAEGGIGRVQSGLVSSRGHLSSVSCYRSRSRYPIILTEKIRTDCEFGATIRRRQ